MKPLLRLHKNNKTKPLKKSSTFGNSVLYYPLKEKCTWKETFPPMTNPNYILLFGVSVNHTLNKQEVIQNYFHKPYFLYEKLDYVKRKGKAHVQKDSRDMSKALVEYNYSAFIINIKQNEVLITDNHIENIIAYQKQEKKQITLENELKFYTNICKNINSKIIQFPPIYNKVNNFRSLKLVEPHAYIIVDPSCIVDAAIGTDAIKKMIKNNNKQSNKVKKKSTPEKSLTTAELVMLYVKANRQRSKGLQ